MRGLAENYSYILPFLVLSVFPLPTLAQSASEYIPWSWRVTPNSDTGDYDFCPSTLSILVTFAAVNVFVSVASLIMGHRGVVRFFTCGCCDGEDDKGTWFYMFIFPLALNLGPNALIAYLYKSTPGFGDNFSIWQLTLFYVTRPRLSWLVLVIFMSIDAARDKETNYIRSAKAAVASEFCLQIVSGFYTGWTAHFATQHGYYLHPHEAPHTANVMYAGALLCLVSLFFTLISLGAILFSDAEFDTSFGLALIISCTSWLGAWIFWGGFIGLSGSS